MTNEIKNYFEENMIQVLKDYKLKENNHNNDVYVLTPSQNAEIVELLSEDLISQSAAKTLHTELVKENKRRIDFNHDLFTELLKTNPKLADIAKLL